MRALGLDPVHDTRDAFDGLLEAMSRPGTVQSVPSPADQAVVSTLVDHEVTLSTTDETLRDALSDQGRLDAAPPEAADIVHLTGDRDVDVRECERGTLVEPSDGATVVYRVASLAAGAAGAGTTVRITGPGVDGETTLSVSLPAADLAALTDAQSSYPRGVDAVFAADDSLAALPRSLTAEVV
ncbi:phosphonate C-P lyase system protein PhnH [Haloarcula taiwanensis]|uniref:Phosphonate C-P lyase system protein PhnH n=1 Tax=Haloarcula taiwanensis TaxID=1932004 RepID=A0A2H5A3J9_9EURY|nr:MULTISPECIES: phosphonate C-P lyase system protein PhnH [Haloarcula]AUG49319.1 phosphonate C-P lyase system protein PhnH [Haloarcula taiwanensis]RLM44101.1 phosphonate C-P lyase system protein PhnH [Haloarcula sp. Atlit-47R]